MWLTKPTDNSIISDFSTKKIAYTSSSESDEISMIGRAGLFSVKGDGLLDSRSRVEW